MSCEHLSRHFATQVLVQAVSVVGFDRLELRCALVTVIERDEDATRVLRPRELLNHLLLNLKTLLVCGYAVLERKEHRREEAILNVVQVELADVAVKLYVVYRAHVVRKSVVVIAWGVASDLVDHRGFCSVLHIE